MTENFTIRERLSPSLDEKMSMDMASQEGEFLLAQEQEPRTTCKLVRRGAAALSHFRKTKEFEREQELRQMNISPEETNDASSVPDIVGSVVERQDACDLPDKSFSTYVDIPQEGFPVATLRTKYKGNSSNEEPCSASLKQNYQCKSLKETIDHENRLKTERMPESEIVEAQRELEMQFGKELIDKLKQKILKTGSIVNNRSAEHKHLTQEDNVMLKMKLGQGTLLSMDKIEAKKLAWTSPSLTISELNQSVNSKDETWLDLEHLRFDFNGNPLYGLNVSNEMHSNDTTYLYHHGTDPHLPGYTLNEIVEFWLPSAQPQQRMVALRCIAEIVRKGRYLTKANEHYQKKKKELDSHCACTMINDASEGIKNETFCAGFGYGLHFWERYLFEVLEIHWKVFLSCRSSNMSVRSAAFEALAAILLPLPNVFSKENNHCLDVFDSWASLGHIQLYGSVQNPHENEHLLLNLVHWPSAYRSIITNDCAEDFFLQYTSTYSKTTIENSSVPGSLDESQQRLHYWFSNNFSQTSSLTPDKSLSQQQEKSRPPPSTTGLSVFDPILHLLISGDDLREETYGSSSLSTPSGYWVCELGVMLSTALEAFHGNCRVECAVLHICVSLWHHSIDVGQHILLNNSHLMKRLEILALSLTHGTSLYAFRQKNKLLNYQYASERKETGQCQSNNENDDEEIILKAYLLLFFRIVSEAGGKQATLQFSRWDDGMVIPVLVRQTLMENWPMFLVDLQTSPYESLGLHGAILARCEALKLLSIWAYQDTWIEDMQTFFGTFLSWITDIYKHLCQCEQQILTLDEHKQCIILNSVYWEFIVLTHLTLLLSMTLFTDNNNRASSAHSLASLGLIQHLLTVIMKLQHFDFLKINAEKSNSYQLLLLLGKLEYQGLRLTIEVLNFITLATETLDQMRSQFRELSHKTELCDDFNDNNNLHVDDDVTQQNDPESPKNQLHHELHYYISHFEPLFELLSKVVNKYVVSNKQLQATLLQNATLIEDIALESGLYSKYLQIPILNTSQTQVLTFLQSAFTVRLLTGLWVLKDVIERLQFKNNWLIGSFTQIIALQCLPEARLNIVRIIFSTIPKLKCYALCKGNMEICGLPFLLRALPYLYPYHHFLKLSLSCNVLSSDDPEFMKTVIAFLASAATRHQAEKAIFYLWKHRALTTFNTPQDKLHDTCTANTSPNMETNTLKETILKDGKRSFIQLALQVATGGCTENLFLSSNLLDSLILLMLLIIPRASQTPSFPYIQYLDCTRFFFFGGARALLKETNHSLSSPSTTSSDFFDVLFQMSSPLTIIEILLHAFSAPIEVSSITSEISHLFWKSDTAPLEIAISKNPNLESNTVIEARWLRLLDKVLTVYKETPAPPDVLPKLIWLFSMKRTPLSCRELLWKDTVVLQLLMRGNALPLYLIREQPDLAVHKFQKEFISSISSLPESLLATSVPVLTATHSIESNSLLTKS